MLIKEKCITCPCMSSYPCFGTLGPRKKTTNRHMHKYTLHWSVHYALTHVNGLFGMLLQIKIHMHHLHNHPLLQCTIYGILYFCCSCYFFFRKKNRLQYSFHKKLHSIRDVCWNKKKKKSPKGKTIISSKKGLKPPKNLASNRREKNSTLTISNNKRGKSQNPLFG